VEEGENCGLSVLVQGFLNQFGQGSEQTWKHRLVRALLDQAIQGNPRAIHEIWNHLETLSETSETSPAFAIDDAIARKILAAARDVDDEPPSD
jgi:hypothetical protein